MTGYCEQCGEQVCVCEVAVVRIGHLHISRFNVGSIILSHDNGEMMVTSEDKLYFHLMKYWDKEF